MNTYTVIGIHDGGRENRFAESYDATDPSDAECLALAQHPDLLIAGVVEGTCKLVDDDPAMTGEDPRRPDRRGRGRGGHMSAPYTKPPAGHRCAACHQPTYVVEQGDDGRRYAVCLSGHRTRVESEQPPALPEPPSRLNRARRAIARWLLPCPGSRAHRFPPSRDRLVRRAQSALRHHNDPTNPRQRCCRRPDPRQISGPRTGIPVYTTECQNCGAVV